jgi:repressor LexA
MEAKRRTARTVEKIIAAFFRENRRMPTYAEMTDLLGVRSTMGVNFFLKKVLPEGLR